MNSFKWAIKDPMTAIRFSDVGEHLIQMQSGESSSYTRDEMEKILADVSFLYKGTEIVDPFMMDGIQEYVDCPIKEYGEENCQKWLEGCQKHNLIPGDEELFS